MYYFLSNLTSKSILSTISTNINSPIIVPRNNKNSIYLTFKNTNVEIYGIRHQMKQSFGSTVISKILGYEDFDENGIVVKSDFDVI